MNDPEAEARKRIEQIKTQLMEMSGGRARFGPGESDLPPEMEREVLEQILAVESAPRTTRAEQLRRAGFEMPDPRPLSDEQVTSLLGETIGHLADLHVYLSHTDHLSDRELYELLYVQLLHYDVPDVPPLPRHGALIELLEAVEDDEEAARIFLTYYATEDDRKAWSRTSPDFVMPPRRPRPFDRDRHLPQSPDLAEAAMGRAIGIMVEALVLHADWDRSDGAIRLSRDLRPEDVRETTYVRRALALLGALAESGPAKATARRRNLPRSLVATLIPRLGIPDDELAFVREYHKAPNEEDIRPLHEARLMCQDAGMIRLRKGVWDLTRRGQTMLAPEAPLGDLYRRLFLARFRKLNMAYFDGHHELPRIQQSLAAILWRLEMMARDWISMEILPRQILLPAVVESVPPSRWGDKDPVRSAVEFRVLKPLARFGLLDIRMEPYLSSLERVAEVRVSPLFGKFLSFLPPELPED